MAYQNDDGILIRRDLKCRCTFVLYIAVLTVYVCTSEMSGIIAGMLTHRLINHIYTPLICLFIDFPISLLWYLKMQIVGLKKAFYLDCC